MKNKLLFYTKNDIPFLEAQISIHTPTIEEIGMIGEDHFRIGVKLITDVSEKLKSQDNFDSNELTDFDIFMSMMNNREKEQAIYKNDILCIFALLFPGCSFKINRDSISIVTQEQFTTSINKDNFQSFKEIITYLFLTEKEQKEFIESVTLSPCYDDYGL